jgi:hypothetical protein
MLAGLVSGAVRWTKTTHRSYVFSMLW